MTAVRQEIPDTSEAESGFGASALRCHSLLIAREDPVRDVR